jgi:hypothetical protein
MKNSYINGDKYFLISSEEINRLMVILEEEDTAEALFYLNSIIATKTITFGPKEEGLIFFD